MITFHNVDLNFPLKKIKKKKHYVVAYMCPMCCTFSYLENFSGEVDVTCQCGQEITVEIDND